MSLAKHNNNYFDWLHCSWGLLNDIKDRCQQENVQGDQRWPPLVRVFAEGKNLFFSETKWFQINGFSPLGETVTILTLPSGINTYFAFEMSFV